MLLHYVRVNLVLKQNAFVINFNNGVMINSIPNACVHQPVGSY
jgi:hypothetical protein